MEKEMIIWEIESFVLLNLPHDWEKAQESEQWLCSETFSIDLNQF